MKRQTEWLAALIAIAVLAGCVDTSTKITVKADGSGTIEKTIILSRHLAEYAQSMGMKEDRASFEQGMLNEAGLKAEAAQMGSDVVFLSAQRITTEKGNGYRALYSFKNITKVKINRNPVGDVAVPSAAGGGSGGTGGSGASGQQSAPEYLTFTFAKGTPAVLTIVAPKIQRSSGASPNQATAADNEKMMASLKPLYSDLRIALSVEVQGKITETNAAYASGPTVTLMDMDFGEILADDATFKKLAAAQTQSIAEVQALVKALPGVRLDMQETVKIAFK